MKYLKFIKFLILAIVLGILVFKSLHDEDQSKTDPSWQLVVDYAKDHLQAEGQLIRKSDGYIYLKVDDNYVHTLLPKLQLKDKGFHEPPFFRGREAPGAHISVFYENERVTPDEIGQYFKFTPKRIKVVKPSEGLSYVVLEVDAPQLLDLRKKYGVSPKLNGHEFHISLGKKVKHPRRF